MNKKKPKRTFAQAVNASRKYSVKKTANKGLQDVKNKKAVRMVPWGRTLSTKDNYLGEQKTGSKKTRPVVVVDVEGINLAVVPLSSKDGKNRTEIKGYENKKNKRKKTYFKHYLEIEDDEGNPIRVNEKFRENHKNMDLSRETVLDIRQNILTKAKTKQRNKKLYDKFHNKK